MSIAVASTSARPGARPGAGHAAGHSAGSGAGLGEVGRAALQGLSRVQRASRLGQLKVAEGESTLPVLPGLADLLPGGALRRGSVLTVQGSGSLLLAVLAAASAQGAWCAEVGSPLVGSAAAAELGVALERFVRVPEPGGRWAEVVASLLDGLDVVVVHPPLRRTARDDQAVRRLSARTRERGAVLIASGPWEGAALGLTVTAQRWHGLGRGHGRLSAREVEVSAVGRGSAVRPRLARLWLPGPDGQVGLVAAETSAPADPVRITSPLTALAG